jgi:hypothetical protein
MKNPLELTLLEVEALLHDDPDGPQKELTHLIAYVHFRQNTMKTYQVQKEVKQITTKETMPRRRVRSVEAELLDNAELVIVG